MNRNVSVGETDPNRLRAYFDVRLLDFRSPALNEASGTPQYSLNGGGWNSVGISQLVAIGFGQYSAQLDGALVTTPGDVIRTRYQSPQTAECRGDTFQVVLPGGELDPVSVSFYGTVLDGSIYFSTSLRGKAWKRASFDDQQAALTDATQVIDKLNFAGDKASDGQVLQFPRGNTYVDPISFGTGQGPTIVLTGDVNVPEDVKRAAYIIADRLLDGWDPDIEADVLATQSTKTQGVSTVLNREYIPEHMRAGIPSASAWSLLRPYVRDPQEVSFARL